MLEICGIFVLFFEFVEILNLEDDVDKGYENGYFESGFY